MHTCFVVFLKERMLQSCRYTIRDITQDSYVVYYVQLTIRIGGGNIAIIHRIFWRGCIAHPPWLTPMEERFLGRRMLLCTMLFAVFQICSRDHRNTQDVTMKGVHREWIMNFLKGGRARWSRGRKFHSGIQGQYPGRGFGVKSPEAEAKREISVQYLTFSCTKYRI